VRTVIFSAREAWACAPNKISIGARGGLFAPLFAQTKSGKEKY
jgi:hypothetical protein